jgi:WD40 repeat protein
VVGASWDREGKRVLSWSQDGTVRVWDIAANRALAEHKHAWMVLGASWDREGKRVLSWGEHGTVRVWDIAANRALAEHEHHWVLGASWDREGKRVLSWSADGTVRILDFFVVTPWVPLPHGSPEGDLTVQVEAHTGLRLDEAGRLIPLSQQEWLQRKQRFEELKAQASR